MTQLHLHDFAGKGYWFPPPVAAWLPRRPPRESQQHAVVDLAPHDLVRGRRGNALAALNGPPGGIDEKTPRSARSTEATSAFGSQLPYGWSEALVYRESVPVVSDVERLIDASLSDDEADVLMASLQERLRARDVAVAAALEAAVVVKDSGAALETLAAPRVPAFVDQVFRAVKAGLSSRTPETRFAAVAAVSDLPAAMQQEFRKAVEALAEAEEPDEDVRRAARHLLRRLSG